MMNANGQLRVGDKLVLTLTKREGAEREAVRWAIVLDLLPALDGRAAFLPWVAARAAVSMVASCTLDPQLRPASSTSRLVTIGTLTSRL